MSIVIRQTGVSPGFALRAIPAPGRDAPRPPPADSWLDTLAKLVPGEVIIAFTAALHVSGVGEVVSTHLAIVAVFAALCPIVLWASVRRAGVQAPWLQYVVRSTAFVLFGLGSDRVLMAWLDQLQWIPGVGALVVAALAALVLSPPGAQRPPPELGPAVVDAIDTRDIRAAGAPPPQV
jgi:hypothetical protein